VPLTKSEPDAYLSAALMCGGSLGRGKGAKAARARFASWLMVFVLIAAACTGGGTTTKPTPTASVKPAPRGGTLRIVIPILGPTTFPSPDDPQDALDPAKPNGFDSAELFRCCLARTLFSYVGASTRDGGAILHSDAAASLGQVSGDSLTWTIRLKPGLHYGPPLQTVEITAADFVRGIQRSLKIDPGSLAFFGIIRGAAEFAHGTADSIAGLEILDADTLRISLTEPAGDLGARLTIAAAAPIPPNPSNPAASFGVAEGHDADYGRFVVSSGPYMVEASERLDFSKSPAEQTPISGFVPGHSLTLVRNPAWRAPTDPLRPAYVDRIEISISGTKDEDAKLVDSGSFDFVMFSGVPPQAPPDQVDRYRADPRLGHVFIESRDFIRTIVMNVGVPPFDDLHVRRAVNYIIDKERLRELAGGELVASPAGHIALNSLENNLLLNYDPYATSNRSDALAKALAEMRLSKYAHDAEGRCTANVCQGVLAETFVPIVAVGAARQAEIKEAALIKSNLQEIGIGIVVRVLQPSKEDPFADLDNPRSKLPMHLRVGFGKALLSGADQFVGFYGPTLSEGNVSGSLVGATPEQLRRWGYAVNSVPNVDDRIRACLPATGDAQFACWAGLDQYLMEQVVPWVPYFFESYVRTVGPRVVRYSFAQFTTEPALDQIAVQAGS
jgi:peptide/nickel transport system substrate-binding protein